MDKNVFTVLDENGKEVVCYPLFTFDSNETGKSYMAYTDNTKDDKGNIKVYASIVDPNSETPTLEPIKTEAEWKIVETILTTLQDEIKSGNNGESAE